MTLALQSLVGLCLLVAGATAALPALWLGAEPRTRPDQPSAAGASRLWVVRGAGSHWFVNGDPISPEALARRLEQDRGRTQLRFLPSTALPMEEVSRSLRWLRQRHGTAVVLELPQER